tara:strand:- start:271 stop:792 length:522 start_codon:yes stop_codon:yes gene_type:complete
MEGSAYWIFLALFYLISSMIKKKKQKSSLKKAGEEEKTNGLSSQIDDLFKFLKLDGMAEEKSDQRVESELDEELLYYEDDPSPHLDIIDGEWKDETKTDSPEKDFLHDKKPKSNLKKHHRLVLDKSSRLFERPTESVVDRMKRKYLGDSDNLKSAVLLKEILDKPKALRKTAR